MQNAHQIQKLFLLFFHHLERNSAYWQVKTQAQIQNKKCTNTQIIFLLSPGKELCILASENTTVRPVQLAGNAFHLQGKDQRDFHLKRFHKWKISQGYLLKDD